MSATLGATILVATGGAKTTIYTEGVLTKEYCLAAQESMGDKGENLNARKTAASCCGRLNVTYLDSKKWSRQKDGDGQ
jgi:hypothetical protein